MPVTSCTQTDSRCSPTTKGSTSATNTLIAYSKSLTGEKPNLPPPNHRMLVHRRPTRPVQAAPISFAHVGILLRHHPRRGEYDSVRHNHKVPRHHRSDPTLRGCPNPLSSTASAISPPESSPRMTRTVTLKICSVSSGSDSTTTSRDSRCRTRSTEH